MILFTFCIILEKFGNRDYILTIDYATMDDDAEYTVSARNVAGTEKLSAQVIVEPRSGSTQNVMLVFLKRQRIKSLIINTIAIGVSNFFFVIVEIKKYVDDFNPGISF